MLNKLFVKILESALLQIVNLLIFSYPLCSLLSYFFANFLYTSKFRIILKKKLPVLLGVVSLHVRSILRNPSFQSWPKKYLTIFLIATHKIINLGLKFGLEDDLSIAPITNFRYLQTYFWVIQKIQLYPKLFCQLLHTCKSIFGGYLLFDKFTLKLKLFSKFLVNSLFHVRQKFMKFLAFLIVRWSQDFTKFIAFFN